MLPSSLSLSLSFPLSLPPSLSLSLSLFFFFQERNSIIKRQLKVVPRLAKPFILSANRTYYASTSLNLLRNIFYDFVLFRIQRANASGLKLPTAQKIAHV